jgi:hypothetical protein
MTEDKYRLTKEEQEKANEERKKWEKKAVYWHNALPNFNYDMRRSLTTDAQTAFDFEQLELNKKLYWDINLNNWITVAVSVINLVLLGINLWLLLR